VPEPVDLAIGEIDRALLRERTLGDDDDRGEPAALVPADDPVAHLVDVERTLRDEHDRGAAGDAGVGRDPPAVAAHHLDDQHAVVALGGGVEAIDRVGGDLHRRVEAERDLGALDVVVDRLRHADDRQPCSVVQLAGDAERAVATDRRSAPSSPMSASWPGRVDTVGAVERAAASGAEHRAAAGQHAAHRLDGERQGAALHHAVPRIAEPDDLVAVLALALADDGAQHRVQAGAVAPTGQHSDSHGRAYATMPTLQPLTSVERIARRSAGSTRRRCRTCRSW
jgi:hypothetical protein